MISHTRRRTDMNLSHDEEICRQPYFTYDCVPHHHTFDPRRAADFGAAPDLDHDTSVDPFHIRRVPA